MRDKINDDLKTAMKAGEKERVGTLRLVNAAIKSADIEARPSGKDKISDADILGVLAKMIKQRRDSIDSTRPATARSLPTRKPPDRSSRLHAQADERPRPKRHRRGDQGGRCRIPKDMGKVMGALKAKYAGQMDFGKASAAVKELLK
jgi:uncharacterized protein YqeY